VLDRLKPGRRPAPVARMQLSAAGDLAVSPQP
jgi:hypothetical protein